MRNPNLHKRLATARAIKAHLAMASSKKQDTPKAEAAGTVPTHPSRDLASKCAKDAMIMGWDKAIQKHAYENNVPEDRMKQILDTATAYNDKADPSGRIDELRDWKVEKQGRSSRSFSASRSFG